VEKLLKRRAMRENLTKRAMQNAKKLKKFTKKTRGSDRDSVGKTEEEKSEPKMSNFPSGKGFMRVCHGSC